MIYTERSFNKVISIHRSKKNHPVEIKYTPLDFDMGDLNANKGINFINYYSNPITSKHLVILDLISDTIFRSICNTNNITPSNPHSLPSSWFLKINSDLIENLKSFEYSFYLRYSTLKIQFAFLKKYDIKKLLQELSEVKFVIPYYDIRTKLVKRSTAIFPNYRYIQNEPDSLFDLEIIDKKESKNRIFDITYRISSNNSIISKAYFMNCKTMNLDLITDLEFYNLSDITQAIYRCFILPAKSKIVNVRLNVIGRRLNIFYNLSSTRLLHHLQILKEKSFIKDFKFHKNRGNSYIEIEKNDNGRAKKNKGDQID